MGSRIKRRLHKFIRREGFTLVEVLVASLLLLFAMAGIVPFFLTGLTQASVVRYRSEATNIAREKIEQIRQLDSRDIPTEGDDLETRFGVTETQRDISFDIGYAVEESVYENGLLKKVTVTVSWTGPPEATPEGKTVSMATMIHEQFLGPRVSQLVMSHSLDDPLETPFPMLYPSQAHTLICYVAEADWGLVLNNLNEPGMSVRDVYARLVLVDSNGQSERLGDPANDYRLENLQYTTDTEGKVTSAYFSYTFNSADIPDGYWEFRAIIYNEYNEPGNVWRLRTRVENEEDGGPAMPTDVWGIPQIGDESILLVWSGGDERDRAYYVLERCKWEGGVWSEWTTLEANLDPNATSYTDQGSVALQIDPWGTLSGQNWYQYRLWAVDICLDPPNVGPEATIEVAIPELVTTTTTLLDTTTTTLVSVTTSSTTTTVPEFSLVKVENTTNKAYSLYLVGDNGFTLNTSVARKSTKTISSLPAGNYLLTATASGRPTLNQSFSLPQQAGNIVMTIL